MATVRRRQLGFTGHVLRGDGLQKDCLLGMIEGRARGRQRIKYMDGIKEMVGREKIEEVMELTADRKLWRSIVANVN